MLPQVTMVHVIIQSNPNNFGMYVDSKWTPVKVFLRCNYFGNNAILLRLYLYEYITNVDI